MRIRGIGRVHEKETRAVNEPDRSKVSFPSNSRASEQQEHEITERRCSPNSTCCLFPLNSDLSADRVPYLICNTYACAACAEDDDFRVTERLSAHLETCCDGGEGDAACALDVVVKTGDMRAVKVENASRYTSNVSTRALFVVHL